MAYLETGRDLGEQALATRNILILVVDTGNRKRDSRRCQFQVRILCSREHGYLCVLARQVLLRNHSPLLLLLKDSKLRCTHSL